MLFTDYITLKKSEEGKIFKRFIPIIEIEIRSDDNETGDSADFLVAKDFTYGYGFAVNNCSVKDLVKETKKNFPLCIPHRRCETPYAISGYYNPTLMFSARFSLYGIDEEGDMYDCTNVYCRCMEEVLSEGSERINIYKFAKDRIGNFTGIY